MSTPSTVGEVHRRVEAAVHDGPQRSDAAIARRIFSDLDVKARAALVRELLEIWCWEVRREQQLVVERAAQQQANTQHERADQYARERNATEQQHQKYLDDPAAMYGPGSHHLSRRRDRQQFQRWCGERFDEWHERARRYVQTTCPDSLNLFDGDWHPDGPTGFVRDRQADAVRDLVQRYAAELRLEFTAELLASEFALGDGRRVTWANATIAEHQHRIELLVKNVQANAEAAARHQFAVQTLRQVNVDRLVDIPELAETLAVAS